MKSVFIGLGFFPLIYSSNSSPLWGLSSWNETQAAFLSEASQGALQSPPAPPTLLQSQVIYCPRLSWGKSLALGPGAVLGTASNHNYSYQKNLPESSDPRRGPLMEEW